MEESKLVYVVTDGKLHKIGESNNPMNRLYSLRSANPEIQMLFYGDGISEKELHLKYEDKRVALEWFNLNDDDLEEIERLVIINKPNDRMFIKDGVECCTAEYYFNQKKLNRGEFIEDDIVKLETYNLSVSKGFTKVEDGKLPTKSLIQKWLRDDFGRVVLINIDRNDFFSFHIANHILDKENSKKRFISYESALEYGILYALNLDDRI